MARRTPALTEEELFALPVTVDVPTAGRAWGLGRSASYELARSGEFPCRVLPCKARFIVTKTDLLQALGYEAPEAPPAETRQPAA